MTLSRSEGLGLKRAEHQRAALPLAGFGASELFQLLRDGQPRTRAELAASTGFARATITSRIDELMDLGLISPVADAVSTGGRPSSRVAFNPAARVIAAADIGATHATVAITDLAGSILAEVHENLRISAGPKPVLDWLRETVSKLLSGLSRDGSELIAVGIGLPGPVEYSSGKPSNPPIMPGWDGFDVPGYIQLTYDVPVLVDNDVNIMALGERAMCWPEVDHMIFLKVSTGIGSGIISGGLLQHGANGSAGDVGHIPVTNGSGIRCRCGSTGCLEAVAGAPAIASTLRKHGLDVQTGADVIDLLRGGDVTAMQTIRQAGRDIGEMLNVCITVVNPSVIVIGGSLAQAGEHLLAGIRETVYSRSMPLATQHLSIVQSRMGSEAGVVGAGIMAIEHVLAPEQLETRLMAARGNTLEKAAGR